MYFCVCVCLWAHVRVPVCAWQRSFRPSPAPLQLLVRVIFLNFPTCLGRGSDTILFPHNAEQTEGAGGRGRRASGQKQEQSLTVHLLLAAMSRRQRSAWASEMKRKRWKREKTERKKRWRWRRGGRCLVVLCGLKRQMDWSGLKMSKSSYLDFRD